MAQMFILDDHGWRPLTAADLAGMSSNGTEPGAATDATLQQVRDRLPEAQPTPGLLPVDSLARPTVPRVQGTAAAASNIVLTAACRRVSMYATEAAWYSLSGNAVVGSSHYIAKGERLDINVPQSCTISVVRDTVDGSLRVTELG